MPEFLQIQAFVLPWDKGNEWYDIITAR